MLTNREVGTISALALLSLTAGAFTTPPELGCVIGFAAIAVGWLGVAVFGWLRDRRTRVPPAIVLSARSTRASDPASPPPEV